MWVWSLGWDDLLEEEVATHSSITARKIPWREEPGGLQNHKESDRTEWLSTHAHIDKCNHHCSQQTVLFYKPNDPLMSLRPSLLHPLLSLTLGSLLSLLYLYNFVIWRMWYKRNHGVWHLGISFFFFIQYNALEVYPNFCMYQYFIAFLLFSSSPLRGCIRVCSVIYSLKDVLVVANIFAIRTKALRNISVQVFVWTEVFIFLR